MSNQNDSNLGGFPMLKIHDQRAVNAAILQAIKQTEDVLERELNSERHMADYYRREADEYFYRWRSE